MDCNNVCEGIKQFVGNIAIQIALLALGAVVVVALVRGITSAISD